MIAGIYLAAGESRRFGGEKLLYSLEGMPLFWYGLSQCVASKLPEIRVVVGTGAAELESEIERLFPGEPKLRIDRNHDPGRGMMSSLKTGLRSVEGRFEGAMVLLADMPLVTAAMINELIAAFEKDRKITIPECDGELRHPRIIPKRYFAEFLALGDDERGTAVLDGHPEEVVRVPLGSRLNYVDVDRPEDLDVFGTS
jgi:molybdenum cofactor cytidylyltransferase